MASSSSRRRIPLTPQTDEENFPVCGAYRDQQGRMVYAPPGQSGAEYPKMLTKPFTKEDREEWLRKNVRLDRNTREEYYEERCPKLGERVPLLASQDLVDAGLAVNVNDIVVAHNAGHEQQIMELLDPATADAVSMPVVNIPLRDNSAGLAARTLELEAENEKLREQLASAGKAAGKARDQQRKAPKAKTTAAPAAKPKAKSAAVKAAIKAAAQTAEEFASVE